MASYNRVVMVGNLTRDPEYKQLPSGQAVCRLGIASNRQFKNRQTGMQIQEVCYIDIDVWGPQADSCNQYLQKGRGILVEGRLKFDTWQDQQGATRSKHSIVADRVVFLSNQGDQAGMGSDMASSTKESTTFGSEDTQEFAKVAQAVEKKKTAVAAKKTKKNETQGAPEFTDEPPFEDELPF